MKGDVQLGFPPRTPEQRLIWEIIFLLPITITAAIFGNPARYNVIYTIILSLVFVGSIIARFFLINEQGDWIFFLIGFAVGGGNDLLSMINGVYNYTSITILPFLTGLMPLWNIAFWGQVFLLFRKVFHVNWFSGKPFKKDGVLANGWLTKKLLVDICILVLLRITIYNTYLDPFTPTAIYGALIVIRMIFFKPEKNEWLIMAILPYAFMYEGLLVTFGLYVYYNPVFLGLPAWLMLWWVFLVPLVLKQVFDIIEFVLHIKITLKGEEKK